MNETRGLIAIVLSVVAVFLILYGVPSCRPSPQVQVSLLLFTNQPAGSCAVFCVSNGTSRAVLYETDYWPPMRTVKTRRSLGTDAWRFGFLAPGSSKALVVPSPEGAAPWRLAVSCKRKLTFWEGRGMPSGQILGALRDMLGKPGPRYSGRPDYTVISPEVGCRSLDHESP